mgnify:CR=1 FL=1
MKIDIQALELEKGAPLFSMEEIKKALKGLVNGKVKNKRRSTALKDYDLFYNPQKFSLLPIGLDGQSTIHVYDSEETKEKLLWDIYRLVNDFENGSDHVPKFTFKKFKCLSFETKPEKIKMMIKKGKNKALNNFDWNQLGYKDDPVLTGGRFSQ